MISSVQDPSAGAVRILDAMPFAVIGLSRRDIVTFVNPAAETLLARSAPLVRGRPLVDLLSEDSPLLDFIGRARREGGVVSARAIRLASPQIGAADVDVSAAPDGEDGALVLTLNPQRVGQGQEESASEVNAFAQVARMLGHEVKNPLAGIVGAAQLLARKAQPEQQPLLSLIREEGARIQRIVDRFVAFETFFSPRARMTNVHVVIDSVVDLAKASFGATTKIELAYDPSLPEIEVDPDHLHEACLNLVKNAIEAASAQRGPRIVIATRYRAGFRFAGRDLPRARGALEISVTDNGPGVPEATANRIFEPFFTTKSGGAGIGLAVVTEIMQAHGGFVVLDNSPGGACLRLLFPFARKKGATP